jgi:formylglycine-generating enzyme required for sulfatase activity
MDTRLYIPMIILLGPLLLTLKAGAVSGQSFSQAIADDIIDVTGRFLSHSDFRSYSLASPEMNLLLKEPLNRRKAQKRIEDLMGIYVSLPVGIYVMGPPEAGTNSSREPDPWHNEETKVVRIEKSFHIAQSRVTQGQYEAVMGAEKWNEHKALIKRWTRKKGEFSNVGEGVYDDENFIGKRIGMILLTASERMDFIAALNTEISSLWEIAYPRSEEQEGSEYKKRIKFRLPTEAEREYATTLSTGQDTQVVVMKNQEEVVITARHQRYPSGDSEDCLVPRREWRHGPYAEDAPELTVNSRGLKGLNGNLWEVTSDTYCEITHPDLNDSSSVAIRGGGWQDSPDRCRSASRDSNIFEHRQANVGLRLVYDIVEEPSD